MPEELGTSENETLYTLVYATLLVCNRSRRKIGRSENAIVAWHKNSQPS